MLQVVQIPDPAAGHDWSWTVPGEYRATLVAVQANLNATQNPSTATDASGGGHDGVYDTTGLLTWGAVGPFGGSPNSAVSIREAGPVGGGIIARVPPNAAFDTATLTCEGFAYASALSSTSRRIMALAQLNPPADRWDWNASISPGSWAQDMWIASLSQVWTFGVGASATWFHVAATWDGVTWTVYVNGASVGTHTGNGPTLANTGFPLGLGGFPGTTSGGSSAWSGRLAALALYPVALTAGQIATHYAARTSAAAYKAAVLADAPTGLWLFDETVTHFQRTAILTITDGTNTVAQFPGFTPSQQSPLFSWTWTTGALSASQLPDQSSTIIPITPVTLDPGYVVKTVTPDLQALDLWQDISVWFDLTSTVPGAGGDVGYLDGTLTPQYGGT